MAKRKKKLKELTIKDNFIFGTTMTMEPENCAGVIERATGIVVERIEVCKEKSMVYHPEYKGVRLDVYANDENHTHYNVEMQAVIKPELGKRSRYYHSQMDMELLLAGKDYSELPNTFVIFICDFDPFGAEKYRYTFTSCCKEDRVVDLNDGSCTIFLSTHGKNEDEVPETLVKFLEFVKADLEESTKDFEDEFVGKLQDAVRRIKESREMEERYMLLEELIRDERAEEREAMNKLIRFLLQEKRYEDLERATEDIDFREKLYEEFHIE